MNPFETSLWDAIDQIREVDGRYPREAYAFVIGALGVTVQALPPARLDDPAKRHLSGQELLDGVVLLARNEFGALAPTVFSEWRVTSGEDVGAIVFQLVQSGQLSARPEDSIDDFRRGSPLLERLSPQAIDPHSPRSHGTQSGPGAAF